MIHNKYVTHMRQIALAASICLVGLSANASVIASDTILTASIKNETATAQINNLQLPKFGITEIDIETARSLTAGTGSIDAQSEASSFLSVSELTDQEAKQLKGGTYFAPLTRNQLTVAATGAVVWGTFRTAVSALSAPDITTVYYEAVDSLVCEGIPLLLSVFLGQAQISAGKVDERNLGVVDVVLGLTHGTILASTSGLCKIQISASSLNTNSNAAGRKLLQLQDRALAAQTTAAGRKLLQDKWTAQDQRMVVLAKAASNYANKAGYYSDLVGELVFLRNGCGLNPFCYSSFNAKITTARHNRDENIRLAETTMTQTGQLAEARMDTYGGDIMKPSNAATLSPAKMKFKTQWKDNSICVGC